MAEQLSRKQQCVSSNLTIASTILARVPGVGLLNRTCKSWVERHEVQLLRGLPKSENGCVAQTELEQASHKREVGGSTPPTASTTFSICDCRFPIGLSFEVDGFLRGKRNRQSKIGNRKCPRSGDVTDSIEVLQTSCEGLNPSQSTKLRR